MRKNKMFLFVLLVSLIFPLVGCNNKSPIQDEEIEQEKVEILIQEIDELGAITLRKQDTIEELINSYNALTDKEKETITNRDILFKAKEEINYLLNEDKYIIDGYSECINYLESIIPDNIKTGNNYLELPKSYSYETEFKEYYFILKWDSNDKRTINSDGYIYHKADEAIVMVECEISCLVTDEKRIFTKEIVVEENSNLSNDGPVVIAYYYGGFKDFSDTDYEAIDIMNYSFAQIASRMEGSKTIYYIDVSGASGIKEINKVHARGMKVCLSIGGWHDDATFWDTYSKASSTIENRKMVANSILEVMEKYQLDGIDMDWEYPKSADRDNFTLLMKEISDTLKAKDPNYIVSIAVPCGAWATSRYDYKELNKCLDYINVMSYDLDDGDTTTHLTGLSRTISGANVLINAGVDKEKVVIGAAFYGRIFNDVNSNNNGLNQSYASKSSITYTKIKNQYLSRLGSDVNVYYDQYSKAYYLYDSKNRCMISYDSVESIKDKYNYVLDNSLGGIMYWSHKDDETGDLINAINEVKNKK